MTNAYILIAILISLSLLSIDEALNEATDIIPTSSVSWTLMESGSNQFTARNAHATCVFNGKIWLTGGRSNVYNTYNYQNSYQTADVWYSEYGDTWTQQTELIGDFYAQNSDVKQPGLIAPWYSRFGHTLDSVTMNDIEYMILTGGFAPDPMNDVWITTDGSNWVYCNLAPWSPRAWHATALFQNKLYLMGGTPLNNEVWYLESITRVNRTKPLTRAMFNNYTYIVNWQQMENAPWAPRVGMSALSHWYFNSTAGQNYEQSIERLVVIGGYGGFLTAETNSNGFSCFNDVWMSSNGSNWVLLNSNASFGPRAWFAATVFHGEDPRLDIATKNQSAYIFLVGGGSIGTSSTSNAVIQSMNGFSDLFRSRDGVNWVQVNFEEGGGTTFVPKYSSQEWSQSNVNGESTYLGMWGMTVENFNTTDGFNVRFIR